MNPTILRKYESQRVPRCTSYPTSPHFQPIDEATYREWLAALPADARVSLYLHVPFCHSLCWYCTPSTSLFHWSKIMSWLPFWRRPRSAPPEAPAPAVPPTMEAKALDALRGVEDPELGINIVDLGLVYELDAGTDRLGVRLGMTTPSCPLGDHLTGEADRALRRAFPEIPRIEVDLVRDRPWSPERMTDAARRQLGWR